MAKIPADYGSTPDVIPPIEPGEYRLTVTAVPEIVAAQSGKGDNLVVKMQIAEGQGEESGKGIVDYLFLGNDLGKAASKRFLLSCGFSREAIEGNQVDLEEVAGKTCRAKIVKRLYTPPGGEQQERANVSDYVYDKGG